MGTEITTTEQPSSQLTRWSPPVLPASLAAIVRDSALWAGGDAQLPALTADDRAAAEGALAVYAAAPHGSTPQRIAAFVGTAAAVLPRRRDTEGEARMRLAVYETQLADIDSDVLAAAFDEAVRTLTFFPTIAEIRAIAGRLPAPPRVWIAWRLRQLLRAAPAAPVIDPVQPEEVAELLNRLSSDDMATPARVQAKSWSRSMPSYEDYLGLGLSEDEALEQWEEHRRIMAGEAAGDAARDAA
ncbi:MAG: hypothetical protein PGN09_07590 [Sphingomonas fennica]